MIGRLLRAYHSLSCVCLDCRALDYGLMGSDPHDPELGAAFRALYRREIGVLGCPPEPYPTNHEEPTP